MARVRRLVSGIARSAVFYERLYELLPFRRHQDKVFAEPEGRSATDVLLFFGRW